MNGRFAFLFRCKSLPCDGHQILIHGRLQGCASIIEGIGRPRVEPSFVPTVIDRMMAVEDADSIAAMRALSHRLGRNVGGSTGTNLIACLALAQEMVDAGTSGSIVTLLCDGGERYSCTYYQDGWLKDRGVDLAKISPLYQHIFGSGPNGL